MNQSDIPSSNFSGLRKHFRNDFVAAISVALVALPLSLAIAVGAGVPPIAGLITAGIGGLVTTFLRSGHLSINGPAAGLIGVILAGMETLKDGGSDAAAFDGYSYVLAAIIIAGALQVVIGAMKWGRIADLFPSTVIQGILASIGIIIFAKQMHVAMGTTYPQGSNTVEVLQEIVIQIPNINPLIALISGLGLVLLIFHAKISYKVFHYIPAPVWVLVVSVPIVLLYMYLENHQINVFGDTFQQPKNYLIDVGADWMNHLAFPDFSKINTYDFWMVVISINLLSTVITMAGAKAVDKLDPYKRRTNMNRDLVAMGASSMVSGFLGGLPVITVIVRSTVNVHNHAKTKWSNFYHGLFIALFVIFLIPLIQLFPKAALAAVLVFTGIKLASPRMFKDVYKQGLEQLIFLVSTVVITLYKSPLYGLVGGIAITLVAHLLISRVSIPEFLKMTINPGTRMNKNRDGSYTLKVKGIANFLSMIKLIKLLDGVPKGIHLKIDLSKARLIDYTFQEKLKDFKRTYLLSGGKVQIIGMEQHVASSSHKLALKSLILPNYQKSSPRQERIKKIAADNGWLFTPVEQVESSELLDFEFFQSRPLETKSNIIAGEYEEADWEISDVVFDEGAMLSKEVFKTTLMYVQLPQPVAPFVLEAEGVFDRIFEKVPFISGHRDIDFDEHPIFSKKMKLTSSDEKAVRKLFVSSSLISFLESEEVYHIECNGDALIMFKSLRQANTGEIKNMIRFTKDLVKKLVK